jgi:hypothetical protein
MIPLSALWLPILVSAVGVFIASNLFHMAIPAWHRGDYGKLDNEKVFLDALASTKSGQYIAPHVNWGKLSPEERDAMMARPMAFALVRNPAKFSFPKTLGLYFLYLLVISILVGYVAGVTMASGTAFRDVFRVVGTIGILAYAFGTVSDAIWYGKPWSVVAKFVIDGVIYGLVTGAIFGWLWPH